MQQHTVAQRAKNTDNHISLQKLAGAFLSLKPELQRAVAREGYQIPTAVQEQSIPYILAQRDVIGTAQTGTGKTAAFTLPLLQNLSKDKTRYSKGTPRALILAPTRELAAQIGASIFTYGRFLSLKHTVVFGGVKQFFQVKALRDGIDILVATPGRLLDLMNQGHIHLEKVEYFILDEVDRMLDMGFLPDMQRVLKVIPKNRQTLFFSATMPPKLITLANTIVKNPAYVSIEPEKPAVERIDQRVFFVGKENKDALLLSLLHGRAVNKAIIFTQMKHVANKVVKKLQGAGFPGEAIHGNKSQAARTKTLNGFKRGQFQILVATDVAARGLDVDDVSHVINYDLPVEAETYVHRIGRTARAGANGDAFSFCSSEERAYLRDIEQLLGNRVETDLEHAYHSEEASRSLSKPTPYRTQQNSRRNGRSKSRSYRGKRR